MARTDALSIYTDSNTRDKLAEIQGFVIETVQKSAVSEKMKNTEYSGDPAAGSVEIDRFKNAQVDDYGTARAAGAGNKILNTGKVTINIDEDKEIVEEIAKKDVKLYGIASIVLSVFTGEVVSFFAAAAVFLLFLSACAAAAVPVAAVVVFVAFSSDFEQPLKNRHNRRTTAMMILHLFIF